MRTDADGADGPSGAMGERAPPGLPVQPDLDRVIPETVAHYLGQIEKMLRLVAEEPDPQALLDARLVPDMFDVGFNFAVAIQFAARAMCLPAGSALPEIPEEADIDRLLAFGAEVSALTAPIRIADFAPTVDHRAGDADLTQGAVDYVHRFAIPNMIFHMSIAYAGLRVGGMRIGKADFDGFHIYD